MKNLFILVLAFNLSAVTFVSAQSEPTQKERFQKAYDDTKTLVQSKTFKYVGEVVFTDTKRARLDGSSNTFTINDDNASGSLSELDAEAKSHSIDGEISNYNINFNDDSQTISIEFSVNKMKIYIDIKANGNAFLTVEDGVNNITQRGKLQNI